MESDRISLLDFDIEEKEELSPEPVESKILLCCSLIILVFILKRHKIKHSFFICTKIEWK